MRTKFENIILSCQIRFERGDARTWKHSDFLALSRAILRDTKVSISTNTLKRIFGKISVDAYYVPQQATIQALEKYGQNLYTDTPPDINETAPIPAVLPAAIRKKKYRFVFPVSLIAVIALAVFAFAIFRQVPHSKAGLDFMGMEGELPATAFFNYEVPESKDSLFLNFGDKTPWIHVVPGKAHLTHVYLYPGVFNATLRSRKATLRSTTIYIPSNKWIGLGYRQGEELPRNYYEFVAVKTGKDRLFHISNTQLKSKGIDTSGLVYTRLCNFTPLNYTGENFVFEATFKNKVDEEGIYCKSTQFQISGLKNRIRFRLASPGCSNRITNNISERSYVGTKVNLSRFTLNLNRWTSVKMINHDKKISLYVNNELLYSDQYQQSIGEIKGLFLEFEGTAFVKACKLSAGNGKILYQF